MLGDFTGRFLGGGSIKARGMENKREGGLNGGGGEGERKGELRKEGERKRKVDRKGKGEGERWMGGE